jgi:hypothetical protein
MEMGEFNLGDSVRFGDYRWRVFAKAGEKALLLTENVVGRRPYENRKKIATWADCGLRSWLNGEFLSRFSEAERERISLTHNENPKNKYAIYWGKPINALGGVETDDYVFLLSLDEVRKYFGEGDPSQWDEKPLDGNGEFWRVNDEFNPVRIHETTGRSPSWWWLRSPGYASDYAALVGKDGSVHLLGAPVYGGLGGVRPAIWIKMEGGRE